MTTDGPPLKRVAFAGDVATVRSGDVIRVATLPDGAVHVETSFDPIRLAAVLRRIAENVEEGAW